MPRTWKQTVEEQAEAVRRGLKEDSAEYELRRVIARAAFSRYRKAPTEENLKEWLEALAMLMNRPEKPK